MDISISNPKLRDAIYEAFDGKCFYTGRQVPIEEMSIDHVLPKKKGGKDNIYNYVLTDKRTNFKKSANIDENRIDKMLFIIKSAYIPKLKRILKLKLKRKNTKYYYFHGQWEVREMTLPHLKSLVDEEIEYYNYETECNPENYYMHMPEVYLELERRNLIKIQFLDDKIKWGKLGLRLRKIYKRIMDELETADICRSFDDRWLDELIWPPNF